MRAATVPFASVTFSPDGKQLASADHEGTVKVWDAASGREMLTLIENAYVVSTVVYSPDGMRLAAAGSYGTVQVLDARPWTPELRAEQEALSLIRSFFHKGLSMDSVSKAITVDATLSDLVRQRALEFAVNEIKLEQLRRGPRVAPPASPQELMNSLALNGQELLYLQANQAVMQAKFRDGTQSVLPLTDLATRLLASRQPSRFLVLSQDRLLEIAPDSTERPRELKTLPQHVHDLAVHPTDDRIAVCQRLAGKSPEIIVSQLDGTGETNLGFGYDPIWSTDGQQLLYTCSDAQDPWFIAIQEGTEKRRIKIPWHPAANLRPCPSPDGKQVAFSMKGENGTMQIGMALLDGTDIRQVTHAGDFNTRAAFSPDGKYLAFTRGEHVPVSVIIVNVETGRETVISHDAQATRPIWITNRQQPQ